MPISNSVLLLLACPLAMLRYSGDAYAVFELSAFGGQQTVLVKDVQIQGPVWFCLRLSPSSGQLGVQDIDVAFLGPPEVTMNSHSYSHWDIQSPDQISFSKLSAIGCLDMH